MPLEIGQRVATKDGKGEIVDIEFHKNRNGGFYRYGLQLDVNRYSYSPVYYFEREVSLQFGGEKCENYSDQ